LFLKKQLKLERFYTALAVATGGAAATGRVVVMGEMTATGGAMMTREAAVTGVGAVVMEKVVMGVAIRAALVMGAIVARAVDWRRKYKYRSPLYRQIIESY
jgi:hypothetical protein